MVATAVKLSLETLRCDGVGQYHSDIHPKGTAIGPNLSLEWSFDCTL